MSPKRTKPTPRRRYLVLGYAGQMIGRYRSATTAYVRAAKWTRRTRSTAYVLRGNTPLLITTPGNYK